MNRDDVIRNRRRGLLATVVSAMLIAVVVLSASPGPGRAEHAGTLVLVRDQAPAVPARGRTARAPSAARAEVTISAQAKTVPIPRSFLGLSTEYATLPIVERQTALYERVLSLLHVPGDGRFVLRIGGDSADHAIFDPSDARLPPWAFPVTPALVAQTVRVIRALNLRVILDLNTVSTTPDATEAWVRAAVHSADLPAGGLAAFEIGNEPDIWSRKQWAHDLLSANPPADLKLAVVKLPKLPKTITASSYATSYFNFARALGSPAPRVPLVAPALALPRPHLPWIVTLLHRRHPRLRVISAHVYPYGACSRPGDPFYPTVGKLLGEQATAGMGQTIRPAVVVAHRAGLSLRLTEINSVTCGGVKGVSNTFATALWAADALFELMRAGVEGVNLHARVTSINDPFYFTAQGLQTHPLLYGLILFKRMLGPSAHLVPISLRSPQSLHLKVWAVRAGSGGASPNRLNILVIDKGRRSAVVDLHLPTRATASVQRLLAPSASSTSGVTLAGQRLGPRANWQGANRLTTIRPSAGGYILRLRGETAALLTVPVSGGTLVAPPQQSPEPQPLFGNE